MPLRRTDIIHLEMEQMRIMSGRHVEMTSENESERRKRGRETDQNLCPDVLR